MKNLMFNFGSNEHKAWLLTKRTHEECSSCRFEFEEFPPCKKGHAAGDAACQHFENSHIVEKKMENSIKIDTKVYAAGLIE